MPSDTQLAREGSLQGRVVGVDLSFVAVMHLMDAAGTTQARSLLRRAPPVTWLVGLLFLVLSWLSGGGDIYEILAYVGLALVALPPLLRVRAEPARAIAMAVLMLGGSVRWILCVAEVWNGMGYSPVSLRVSLAGLAAHGPRWEVHCSPEAMAGATVWLLALLALAYIPARRRVEESPRSDVQR